MKKLDVNEYSLANLTL